MKVNKIKGGGLVVNQIKQFLESSYPEFPPNNIDNYQLDIELSNLYVKVYFSISDKKVNIIVIHRGTKEASDWLNNITYGLNSNAYNFTTRFKISKNTQNKAQKNIGKSSSRWCQIRPKIKKHFFLGNNRDGLSN